MTTVGHPRWVGLCVYISGVRFRGPIAKPQPLHVPWNSSGSATGCTDLVKPYTVESPAAAREIRHVQVFLLQQVRHAARAALLHSVPEVTRVSNNSARNFLLSTEVHASSTDTPGAASIPSSPRRRTGADAKRSRRAPRDGHMDASAERRTMRAAAVRRAVNAVALDRTLAHTLARLGCSAPSLLLAVKRLLLREPFRRTRPTRQHCQIKYSTSQPPPEAMRGPGHTV
ncbi:hypothetical protein MRX96_059170 [Rhipicephalus microplus]